MGRTDEGIQTSKEAFNIAEKEKIEAKYPIIYRSMAMNYEKAGDFKMASEIYKKLNEVQDKIYTNASQEALAEMQTKYETEKKERIIQEQKFNLKKKNYFIIAISVLFLLALLVGWLIYNRIQLKQKAKLQAALHAQQQLAAQSVLTAEENERQRIAKDLHDGVGQMMSVAKMNLSAFENEITFHNDDQKKSFERIINLIDESCKEVRLVSHQMMPNILLKSGLAKAIADFIDKIDQRVLKVQLHTEGLNERIHENIEIVLYRVLQECVNNVIKHAGATHLDISLIHDQDGISVTIEDNGKGFLIDEITDQAGLGLKNMKARVEYLKGEIDFDSTPGKGTLVAIHIPTTNKEIL
jgi:signal transduction histidine kinase